LPDKGWYLVSVTIAEGKRKHLMALEGEELTALTVEQKSEGVQHRERVVNHLTQEKNGRCL